MNEQDTRILDSFLRQKEEFLYIPDIPNCWYKVYKKDGNCCVRSSFNLRNSVEFITLFPKSHSDHLIFEKKASKYLIRGS